MKINKTIIFLYNKNHAGQVGAVNDFISQQVGVDTVLVTEADIYSLGFATPATRMNNLIKRFKPVVVVATCEKLLAHAIKVRKRLGVDFKLVSFITDFSVFNQAMVAPAVDFYVVENAECEHDLLHYHNILERNILLAPPVLVSACKKTNLDNRGAIEDGYMLIEPVAEQVYKGLDLGVPLVVKPNFYNKNAEYLLRHNLALDGTTKEKLTTAIDRALNDKGVITKAKNAGAILLDECGAERVGTWLIKETTD